MSSVLDKYRKAVDMDRKDFIVLFGPPGCGKTSLAAEFPNAQFIKDGKDDGYDTLVRNGLIKSGFDPITVPNWLACRELAKALADPSVPIEPETLVFENLSGFQLHLVDYLVEQLSAGSTEARTKALEKFWAWGGQGLNTGVGEWTAFVQDLKAITKKKNTAGKATRVIAIGHTSLVKDKNPAGEIGEEFYRVDINVHPKFLEALHRDADCVGWIKQKPTVVKKDGVGGPGRAIQEDVREIDFTYTPHATAKNRWGLKAPVSMGSSSKHAFANLVTAITAAKKLNGESK